MFLGGIDVGHWSKIRQKSTKLSVNLLCDDIRRNADEKLLTGCVSTDFIKVKLLSKMPVHGIKNTELYSDYQINP